MLRLLHLRHRCCRDLVVEVRDLPMGGYVDAPFDGERLLELCDRVVPHLVLHRHLADALQHVGERALVLRTRLLIDQPRDLEALECELKVVRLLALLSVGLATLILLVLFCVVRWLVRVGAFGCIRIGRRACTGAASAARAAAAAASCLLVLFQCATQRIILGLCLVKERARVLDVGGRGEQVVLAVLRDLRLERRRQALDLDLDRRRLVLLGHRKK